MNLSKALEHLRHRGFTPSEDLHDEAAAYLYFKRLADQPPPRPADWLARLRTVAGLDPWPGPSAPPYWFQTDYRSRQANATIRAAAIGSIPRPMPPECRPVLLHALAAFDSRVSERAAVVAEYSEDPSLVPVLLEAMRGEPDSYLARAFFSAIEHLNPSEPERLDALADRILLDEQAGHYVIAQLIRRLAAPDPGWPESQPANRLERSRLHAAWKDFLSTHHADIAAGRRYSLADGELPTALFGATCVYTLPDGTRWPPSATASQQ